jgi:hypothetical protein
MASALQATGRGCPLPQATTFNSGVQHVTTIEHIIEISQVIQNQAYENNEVES